MTVRLFSLFKKKKAKCEAVPLRIEGIGAAPTTPLPDDAELAAQALLEMAMKGGENNKRTVTKTPHKDAEKPSPDSKGKVYYQHFSERMNNIRKQEIRMAMRCTAWCEELLDAMEHRRGTAENQSEVLAEMNTRLLSHLDAVEREGGELKLRWQRCLALVTLRMMQAGGRLEEDGSTG